MFFEYSDSCCRIDGEADFERSGVVLVGSNTVFSFELKKVFVKRIFDLVMAWC